MDRYKPDWKVEADSLINAASVAAKKNPGNSMVFNGRHWVQVDVLINEAKRLSELLEIATLALRSSQVHLLNTDQGGSYAAGSVNTALDSIEAGEKKSTYI